MYLRTPPTVRQAAAATNPDIPTTLPTPPGIPYDLFIGFLWGGLAVATLFLVGRLISRWRGQQKFFLDDLLITLAWVFVAITAGLWQWGLKDMYYVLNVNAGVAKLEPDFAQRVRRWLNISFMVELFFYTTLILFKLSMLFFFKRLGSHVDRFNYLWYPILALSICTYVISIGNIEYKCIFNDLATITTYCNTPKATKFLKDTLDANCALDVLTDFLIMTIPMVLLWRTQIKWPKKLAIMSIFSLSLITIAIAIARAADIDATQKSNGLPDGSYLWFWSYLQSFLCIVVACSSSFRQLFTSSSKPKKNVWSPTASYYERFFKSREKKRSDVSGIYDVSGDTPMATRNAKHFNYLAMGSETGSQHTGERLVREETQRPSNENMAMQGSESKVIQSPI